jgi:hypothetical protein
MTGELEEKNCSEKWIEQFCSTGPKSYSCCTNEYTRTNEDGTKTKQHDEITHVKGFSLKGDTKRKRNLENMVKCINNNKKEIHTQYTEFTRGNSQTINVQETVKTFRFTFDKRIICNNDTTRPYGYRGLICHLIMFFFMLLSQRYCFLLLYLNR